MADENHALAESVRSGKYFEQARGWYQAMFIGPVSERTLFLLIAVLAALVALFALLAVSSLLPLKETPAIPIYANGRMDEVQPKLVRLRERKGDANLALMQFFAGRYVMSRESLVVRTFPMDSSFVFEQSSPDVRKAYEALVDAKNPDGMVAKLPPGSERRVTVNGVRVQGGGDKGSALVNFTAEIVSGDASEKSRWTAKLEYNYTGLAVESVTDEKTGEESLKIVDPKFQVVSYGVEKQN